MLKCIDANPGDVRGVAGAGGGGPADADAEPAVRAAGEQGRLQGEGRVHRERQVLQGNSHSRYIILIANTPVDGKG